MGGLEVAGVDALHDDDAGIGAEGPGELAFADVDGVDAGGAALEEDVGEAAGGRADVEGDPAVNGNAEGVERVVVTERVLQLGAGEERHHTGDDADERHYHQHVDERETQFPNPAPTPPPGFPINCFSCHNNRQQAGRLSLEALADTPEFQGYLHREFPQNASELSDPAGRRSFLKIGAFGAAWRLVAR